MNKFDFPFYKREHKIGDECPNCKAGDYTGVWNGKRWMVCRVCGDRGTLDEKGLFILSSEIEAK